MKDAIQEIEFLARSSSRVAILRELTNSPKLTRDDLRTRVDSSRTTVQRNLESLVDQGLASNSYQWYSLTPRGRYIAESFFEFVESTAVFNRLQPVLQWIDYEDLDLELSHLRDATMVVPEDGDPYRMINRHVEVISEAERAFGLLQFTGLHATETAASEVIERGATVEIVAAPEVADTHLTDPRYRKLNDAAAETGRWKIYEYPGEIPFCLTVLDDVVQLVVAEEGDPRGLIETNSDEVRSWATETFEAYKSEAALVIGESTDSTTS